jgi:pimeloyl-ACP methyl ester carboxylesterase
MGTYIDLNGVHSWYDVQGAGEPVVLLHPAAVDSRVFEANLPALIPHFQVFTYDRRGHGRTRDVDGPITFELMADDMIAFVESVVGGPARLVGCSDGAVVALTAAVQRPDLVRQLVHVAGVFHRDGWLPGVLDADAEPPDFMAASYGGVSPDGIEHYPVVTAKLARMHDEEPRLTAEDLAKVACRTLVMLGDDDEVRLEHAIELYRKVPDGELAVVPGTSHGLLVEKPDLCNRIVVEFLTTDPGPTFAPIRRRST